MAWSSLASNQMVSFTDAQGGGFALQSGQSHITSNQCMTKSEALAKYVLNASNMSSYASNQLVPKSVWASGVVGNAFTFGTVDSGSSTGACSGSNTGRTLYSGSTSLAVGTHLYTNSTLTNSFVPGDGTQSYYLHSGSNSYRVTQSGIIDLVTACATDKTVYVNNYSYSGYIYIFGVAFNGYNMSPTSGSFPVYSSGGLIGTTDQTSFSSTLYVNFSTPTDCAIQVTDTTGFTQCVVSPGGEYFTVNLSGSGAITINVYEEGTTCF